MDNQPTLEIERSGEFIGFKFTRNGAYVDTAMQVGLLYRLLTGKELHDLGSDRIEEIAHMPIDTPLYRPDA